MESWQILKDVTQTNTVKIQNKGEDKKVFYDFEKYFVAQI